MYMCMHMLHVYTGAGDRATPKMCTERVKLRDVAVGEVARRQGEDAAEDVHGERHDVAQPPRHVLPLRRSAGDGAVKAEEDKGHGKVGHATAEVAPASGRRVGQAHNRLGVHLPGKHGVQ